MATLTILKFNDDDTAQAVLGLLDELQAQHWITIEDGAGLSWPRGARKPRTTPLPRFAGPRALGAGFWALLVGLIFQVPASATTNGAVAGSFGDQLIREVRRRVTEGSSALFLLARDAMADRILLAVSSREFLFEVVSIDLPREKEAQLRQVFAAPGPRTSPTVPSRVGP